MKSNNLFIDSFVVIDKNSLILINGGSTAQEAYDAGHSLGQYARKIFDSWKLIKYIFA